jgi:hypothetical protein
MPKEIKLAAVGDILMKNRLIASVHCPKDSVYDFEGMFTEVAPYLQQADVTIGNLETTFSGLEIPGKFNIEIPETSFTNPQKNPKTGLPIFNCPDSFCTTLKNLGFQVLTTANNHCMDYGTAGLHRTLNLLDEYGIAHTGTFRSKEETQDYLIHEAKGIKIGILAYTQGLNRNSPPADQEWAINRVNIEKIYHDIHQIKKKADIVIINLHFGKEYHLYPSKKQRLLVHSLLKRGADIILGSHPHVIQPTVFEKIKDQYGITKKRFAIYSLGNFISPRLKCNNYTKSGVILQLTISKDVNGFTQVKDIKYIPTWVRCIRAVNKDQYKIVLLEELLKTSTLQNKSKKTKIPRQIYTHIKKQLNL